MSEELKWNQERLESEWTDSIEFLKSMGLPQNQYGISREEVLAETRAPVVSGSEITPETPAKKPKKIQLIGQGISTDGVTPIASLSQA